MFCALGPGNVSYACYSHLTAPSTVIKAIFALPADEASKQPHSLLYNNWVIKTMSGNNVQNNFKCTFTGESRVENYRATHTHTHARSPGKSFLLGLISTIFPCFYDPKIQVFGVWPRPGPSFPLFQLPWALSSGLWVLGSALDPALSSPAASRLHFVVANFLLTVVWVFHSLRLPACLPANCFTRSDLNLFCSQHAHGRSLDI